MKDIKLIVGIFINSLPFLFSVSAFEKKRNKSKLTVSSTNTTTTTNTQSTNATSLDISTTSEEDPPSTASSSYYRFNLDNYDEDISNFGATANIVNRYKMERKNSQSHAGKMVRNILLRFYMIRSG